MNDERNIEKQLREYAKQRQKDAGDTPPLHPATRNLLQGEVTRLRESRRSRHGHGHFSWKEFLFSSWPRIVGSLGAAAAVVLIGFVLLRPPDRGRMQLAANGTSADKETVRERERDATGLDTLSKQMGIGAESSVLALKDGQSNAPVGAASSTTPLLSLGGAVPALPTQPPPATTPPPATPAIVSGNLTTRTGADIPASTTAVTSATTEAVPTQLFAANEDARAKAAAEPVARPADQSKPDALVSRSFVRLPTPTTTAATLSDADTSGKLLNNFRVEKSGEQVRIIDADGSVYTGTVTLAAAAAAAPAATLQPMPTLAAQNQAGGQLTAGGARQEVKTEAAATVANAPARPAEQRALSGVPADLVAATNYTFKVSGTNLSLGQPIEFAGTFSPEPPSALGGRAGRGGAGGRRGGGGGGGGGGARQTLVGGAPAGGGGFATNTNAFANNGFAGGSGALTNTVTNTTATLFRIQGEATVGTNYRLQINARSDK